MRPLPRALCGLALGIFCVAECASASPRPLSSPGPASLADSNPLDAAWSNKFGLPVCNGTMRAITFYGGQTIVGGAFTQAGPARAHHVAAWDGTHWQALGDGLPGTVDALAVYGTQLIAGLSTSGPSVYAWNGATWTAIGSSDAKVHALCVMGGDLYAGGEFSTMNGVAASRIARWNGSAWSAVGSGITG